MVAIFLALLIGANAEANTLLGTWRQNIEESSIDAPKNKSGPSMFGGGRTTIVIGGIPIPGSSKRRPAPAGTLKNPDVLFCQTMTIEEADDRVRMTYDMVGTRDFVPGDYRGRTTKYSKKRLIEYYETTSRSVEQKFELEGKDRLVVTVVIKPKGMKKTTYRRVFERQKTGDG